jgi:hypothetical protein
MFSDPLGFAILIRIQDAYLSVQRPSRRREKKAIPHSCGTRSTTFPKNCGTIPQNSRFRAALPATGKCSQLQFGKGFMMIGRYWT